MFQHTYIYVGIGKHTQYTEREKKREREGALRRREGWEGGGEGGRGSRGEGRKEGGTER